MSLGITLCRPPDGSPRCASAIGASALLHISAAAQVGAHTPQQLHQWAPSPRPDSRVVAALAQLHDDVEQAGAVGAARHRVHVLLQQRGVVLALHTGAWVGVQAA